MPEELVYMVTMRPDGAFICDVYNSQYEWACNGTFTIENDAHKYGKEQGATSLMDDEDDVVGTNN